MEEHHIHSKMEKVIIQICSRDRPTEIGLLLQSLRTQTYKDFDILILDDGGGTHLTSYYFLQYLVQRLKIENHNVTIIRNETPSGVSKARQQLVDYTMSNLKHKLICRLDDDIVCEPDYIEKLVNVIDSGYDLASGLTVPLVGPDLVRDANMIKPIIGECVLNSVGELTLNLDECGNLYTEEEIFTTHHFRSCALYKRELHEAGVNYNSRLSKNGFREEQLFSFKAILKGFKLGVHTGAINHHLLTPSGGERDTMNLGQFNQEIFEATTKKMFEEHGDFITRYNEENNIKPRERTKGEYIKSINLVSKKEEVNLLE